MFQNSSYLKNLHTLAQIQKQAIETFSHNFPAAQLKKLPFEKLIEIIKQIQKLWIDYDQTTVLPWYLGSEPFRQMLLDELKIPAEDFDLLATPAQKTLASQLEHDLIHYANLIQKNAAIKKDLAKKQTHRYGHLPFGYDGPDFWDEKHFLQKLEEKLALSEEKIEAELAAIAEYEQKIKEKKAEKRLQHQLAPKHWDFFQSFHLLTLWTDQRKDLDFKLNHHYAAIIRELEQRYQIPYQNLKYLFTDELALLDEKPKQLHQITQERLANVFMFYYCDGKRTILTSRQRDALLEELAAQNQQTKILQGMVASRGSQEIYTGIAKIARTPQESAKIQAGDFLVATMTTPDFIMAMNKAAGFITDEGGVTCHAAIIAREMNKPCIIGTRQATKILHDGDLIQLDTKNGTVLLAK